ncbi:transposase [candidate division KSB1 bacterium]|nr:transposase [candidate division KSB1 bacterium]
MKQFYHITWVTHNSRTSQRMITYQVKRQSPLILDTDDEREITSIIAQIVNEDNLQILAYNICKDHIHLILLCHEEEISNIVRKLKGKSTQLYKQRHNIQEIFHLWAQKFSCTVIEDEEQLVNSIEYVKYNRLKHALTDDKKLKQLIECMIIKLKDIHY